MNKFLIAILLTCCLTQLATAQITAPAPSPGATVMQKVGLADVTINYSRPSAKGRKIFGDLLPFDKIWRTGANAPTKLTVSDTVSIEGAKLAPGDYAIYTIPGATEWTVIIGKNPKTQAQDYKDEQQAARFKVKPMALCAPVETFTFDFTDVTQGSANIQLSWETTGVKFKITNDYDAKVMADIKQKTENSMSYYQAASYYYDTNRDLKQALEWINKATEKGGMFFQVYLKAEIQEKLGDYNAAIETANKSIELSKAAKNDDFVARNEKLIAECKAKAPAPTETKKKKK